MAAESLTDFVEIVMGQSPPGDKVSHDTGVPLLNGPTEFGFHHPTPIQFTVDARKIAQPGDLLFCVRGSTTGRMNWAEQKYAIGRGVAAIRHRWAPKLQPFVRAVIEFELPDLLAQATGSTFPNVSASQLAAIPYPSLSTVEQHAIANILGTLDDKIELNRRMNETLEAMARALFKDWFVDFGPTRAKMEGRDPYLAPELWDLFPDKLDEDGKPEGWETQSVIDQAEWVNGAAYGNMHFSNAHDALPVVKIAELKAGVTKNTKRTNTELGDKYRIRDRELLFSWSGNPDTSIDTFIWTGGEAWLNQHIFAVRDNGARTPAFLYTMLKWLKPEFAEIARNKQTTGLGHVTKQDLKRMQIYVGPRELLEESEHLIGPLHARMQTNLVENMTLAQTRDLLLPKLMSGEIRVSDADKIVQEFT